ncbi:MAG: alpha/beta hydrolase [Burkholderiales bacterium]
MHSPEYLETQYNARASIPDHPQIFARWAETSAQVRDSYLCDLDIAYGHGPTETLDLFPAQGEARAMLVFIHGGWWRSLDKSDFSFIVPEFSQRGIVVANINYSLAPAAFMGDMVKQSRDAMAWLYRHTPHFGVDPEKFYIAGHSAGAHLAAMMLATDWSKFADDTPRDMIKGMMGISGIYDLAPLLQIESVNCDLKLTAGSAKKLSPTLLKAQSDAAVFLVAGELESDEFKRQTDLLGHMWHRNIEYNQIVTDAHHLNIVDRLADSRNELFKLCMAMLNDE